jgi:hypothetical protein
VPSVSIIRAAPRGKFLQLHVTIEDEGVFTTPWTSTLTYVPESDVLPENVCAENLNQYYYDRSDTNVPGRRRENRHKLSTAGRNAFPGSIPMMPVKAAHRLVPALGVTGA